ncbi:STE/STE20/MST protein kinase [Thecamonas trahens ATCC 50062]|uniref:non-specific serine/threonine protein kinase n=1 Tax=Thecamonas trahens ATCC 50062 TaxID=461836 RepID=A0A0L0DP18_THETB|nr:STE/STE20/MST protein kinase [Thecamonas trahens ATCC 50062]KNC54052.1 STE/STE20/MST protein kinase [Thecamonas trahens ATCC 50062]|eukprot:XP_013754063.1 STE/STE20/MST protein kinase [Thecamonas trahens ATCC 50062]
MDETVFELSAADLGQDPNEVFQKVEKLGEGSYGSVYKAMHVRTGKIVAIKEVAMEDDLDEIIIEINIMKQLSDPYIVNYFGNYLLANELWIIMEYCGSGSVADLMSVCKECLTEEQIGCIMADTLKGLEYLHKNNKIHRDIKAGNILINDQGLAKLADFGVSGQLKDDDAKRNTVIGTPYWMAPEVIQEIGYSTGVDIWSLGITCIEMADSRPPLCNIHPMRAIFMIPQRPSPTLTSPDEWSDEFNDFIASCLVKEAADRPTATQLLKHAFVNKKHSRSSLLEMMERASTIIEEKGRNFESDDEEASEEDDDDDDYTGTMARVDAPDDGTMVRASADSSAPDKITPEYLVKITSRKQADILNSMPLDSLKALLTQIDASMTREVAAINQKYEKKKAPILTVLEAKTAES